LKRFDYRFRFEPQPIIFHLADSPVYDLSEAIMASLGKAD
jgi:hypothetical protein